MTTAAEILERIQRLPAAERALVRKALYRAGAGPSERRQRCDERWQAIHAIITAASLPTTGRGAWLRIMRHLLNVQPELTYTRKLRPGESYDTLPPFTIHLHTISIRGLRDGYRRYLQTASKNNSRTNSPTIGAV
jgi:hypothetical protein